MGFLSQLVDSLPLALAAVAGLLLLVVLFLRRQMAAARQSSPPPPDAADPEDGQLVYVDLRSPDTSSLASSFDRARRLLRRYVPFRDRYKAPWFLTLGETWAGKTTLLEHSHLSAPFGAPRGDLQPKPGVGWWLFEQAIVLDVLGAYVLRVDGDSSDDADWLSLLRLLRRIHSRRPLDGVVLTIPANLLVDPKSTTAEIQNDAAQRAARLYNKLLQAELVLGMRFPVDVLVTKCDLIEDFTAFAAALPAQTHQQMLGWSNPYAVDTPYQDAWVGQAFTSITGGLQQAGFDICCDGSESPCNTGALLFPHRLEQTEPALQVYLNHLFAQGAYGVPFYFRGLYFCGGTFAPHSCDDGCNDGPEDVLFLRDLFRDKVFAESAVATPTPLAVSASHRRRLLLQGLLLAVVVLGGLGLWWADRTVSREAEALEPVINTLAGDFRAPTGSEAEQQARVEQILAESQKIESYQPRSLLLPASWFSSLDSNLLEVFVRGYEQIVLPAARAGLEHDVHRLDSTSTQPLPPHQAGVAYIDQTPEFRRLAGFLDPLTELQLAADGYNCIAENCAGRARLRQDFAVLTRYLYNTTLEMPSAASRHFYGRLLHKVHAVPFVYRQQDAVKLQRITIDLTGQLYGNIFRANAVTESLDLLVAQVEALENPTTAASANADTYRELEARIKNTAAVLAQPEYAWMLADELDLGPEMDRLYAEIGSSKYLGLELRDRLQAEAQDELKKLQARLAAYRTPDTGPVLAVDKGRLQLKLSDGVEELETAVDTFVGEPFMESEPQQAPPIPPPTQRLVWNPALLQQATDLVKDYNNYVSKDLAEFPPDLRVESQQVALDSLEANMLHLISEAESFEPGPGNAPPSVLEANLSRRVKNFQAATGAIDEILVDFVDLDLGQAYVDFAAVLDTQEYRLLNDAWKLLEAQDLYSAGHYFATWDGSTPPAPAAFGKTTDKELKSYLADELRIVTDLADQYARPVVKQAAGQIAIRDRDPRFEAEYERWNAILSDLDLHKSKKPGNTITTLQDYITGALQTVTLDTCFAPLPAALDLLPGDYFSDHQQVLEQELLARCETLTREQGYACYRRAAKIFDDRLAGRFPFSASGPAPGRAEADSASLKNFFTVFDQAAARLAHVPTREAIFGAEEQAVRKFVSEMEPVARFLAPFLDIGKPGGAKSSGAKASGDKTSGAKTGKAKKPPPGTYGFTVQFRVNTAQEVGADEVIQWSLQVADKTWDREQALTTNQDLSGSWTWGTAPVILELRWADNAPMVPFSVASDQPARIENRAVIYEYDDLWSLITLMIGHRGVPADFPTFSDPRPETLKFVVETRSAPTEPKQKERGWNWKKKEEEHEEPPKTAQATLFVRISLVTPDRTEPLLLPDVFPALAPPVPEKPGSTYCPEPQPAATTGSAAGASTAPPPSGKVIEARSRDPRTGGAWLTIESRDEDPPRFRASRLSPRQLLSGRPAGDDP